MGFIALSRISKDNFVVVKTPLTWLTMMSLLVENS